MATKKTTKMQFLPNQLAETFNKGVCLYVKMAAPGFNASMDSDMIDTGDADKDLIKVTKITLDCPQHKAIRSLHSQIKKFLRSRSVPIPKFMKSTYFIADADIEDTFEQLDRFIAQHDDDLLPSLCHHYEEAKAQAKARLKSAYDEEDYPPVSVLKRMCYIQPEVIELRTPEKLQTINPTLYLKQREVLQAKFADTVEEMRRYLRTTLVEMVTHLQEKLKGTDEEGRPKVVRESALTHIEEFLQSFENRNVTNDEELKAVVAKLRKVMDGTSIEQVRHDEQFRAQMAKAVTGINSELTKLVGTGARKIKMKAAANATAA